MMRQVLLIFTLALLAIQASAQAVIFADPERLGKHGESDWAKKVLTEMQWRIEGKTLHWGERITVPTGKGADTVFFQQHAHAPWDTMLCVLHPGDSLEFRYNDCCGGFNVHRFGGKSFLEPSCKITLRHPVKGREYLALLGEAGMVLQKGENDTLIPECRSAMAPSAIGFSLMEVRRPQAGDSLYGTMCQYRNGVIDWDYVYEYVRVTTFAEIIWLPMGNTLMHLIYDIRKRKWVIED